MGLADVDFAGTTVAVSMGGDGTFLRVVRLAPAVTSPCSASTSAGSATCPTSCRDQVREALTKVFEGKAMIERPLRARRGDCATVRSVDERRLPCWR